jgi:hypothetical protein
MESMTKPPEFQNWMFTIDPDGTPVVMEYSGHRLPIATLHKSSEEKMQVRAALIAAAPGLYSTLKSVLDVLQVMAHEEDGQPAGLAAQDMIPAVEGALAGADFMGEITPGKLSGV